MEPANAPVIAASGLPGKWRALAVAAGLYLCPGVRAAVEDRVEYKYETYAEENGRILVRTHSALFEQRLAPGLATKGTAVDDGIWGPTPTGGPPLAGRAQVPLAEMRDIRLAFQI